MDEAWLRLVSYYRFRVTVTFQSRAALGPFLIQPNFCLLSCTHKRFICFPRVMVRPLANATNLVTDGYLPKQLEWWSLVRSIEISCMRHIHQHMARGW